MAMTWGDWSRGLQGDVGPGAGASGGRAEELELHAAVGGDPVQCLRFVLEAQPLEVPRLQKSEGGEACKGKKMGAEKTGRPLWWEVMGVKVGHAKKVRLCVP